MLLDFLLPSLDGEVGRTDSRTRTLDQYKIEPNRSSLGGFATNDRVDYFTLRLEAGVYRLSVTVDNANGLNNATSGPDLTTAGDFDFAITDGSGEPIFTSAIGSDGTTQTVEFTLQGFSVFFVEINNINAKPFTYMAGLQLITPPPVLPQRLGTAGADTIVGAGAAESIAAGAGDDSVSAGAGADYIIDAGGVNYLRGDDGNDQIFGGVDFDDINGNRGNDTCVSGGGDDWVVGGQGDDSLVGSAGANLAYGNLGNDTIDGGAGADILRGGQDNDLIFARAGDDYVSGDRGDDTLIGGTGADDFHSFGETGLDVVLDFNITEGDQVRLDPGTVYAVNQANGSVVIDMVGGGRVTLVGVQLSSLTGDWIFVG